MSDFFKVDYNVDMVFCIDATGSMGPVINTVKENALNFYNDIMAVMAEKQKTISNMRIRVIVFRDYWADGAFAMKTSKFFELPAETAGFEECVRGIQAKGGGDEPEDGLEALAYAIKSPWTTGGDKRRHIVVLWTDASTHEIGYAKGSPHYPKGMAESFSELTSWWGDDQIPGLMADTSKRLVLFAPEAPYWQQVTETWNNVIHYSSQAGQGLDEYSYKEIVDAICNSF